MLIMANALPLSQTANHDKDMLYFHACLVPVFWYKVLALISGMCVMGMTDDG